MAKLLDPVKLVRALTGELGRRAERAGLPCPVELGLLVDGKKHRLAITPEGANLAAGNIGRSYLRLNAADFTRLVLGHVDGDQAISDRRVEASTNIARTAARALFPKRPMWCPPLDHLLARE